MADQIKIRVGFDGDSRKLQSEINQVISVSDKLRGAFVLTQQNLRKEIDDTKEKIVELTEKARKMQSQGFANSKVTDEIARLNTYLGSLKNAQDQVTSSLNKGTVSSHDATYAMMNLQRVVSDAPFGFVAISNNIEPLVQSFLKLKEAGGSYGSVIRMIITAMTGPAGITFAFSVVTAAVVMFGDEIQKAFTGSNKAIQNFRKEIREINFRQILGLETDLSKDAEKTREVLTGAARVITPQMIDQQLGQFKSFMGKLDDMLLAQSKRQFMSAGSYAATIKEALLKAANSDDINADYDKVSNIITKKAFSDLVLMQRLVNASRDELNSLKDKYAAQRNADQAASDEALKSETERFDLLQKRAQLQGEINKIAISSKVMTDTEREIALKKQEYATEREMLVVQIRRADALKAINQYGQEAAVETSAAKSKLSALNAQEKLDLEKLSLKVVEEEFKQRSDLLDLQRKTRDEEAQNISNEDDRQRALFFSEKQNRIEQLDSQILLNEEKLRSWVISEKEKTVLRDQTEELRRQREAMAGRVQVDKKSSSTDFAGMFAEYEAARAGRLAGTDITRQNIIGGYDVSGMMVARTDAAGRASGAKTEEEYKKARAEVEKIDAIFDKIENERSRVISERIGGGLGSMLTAVGDEFGQSLFRAGGLASAQIGRAFNSMFQQVVAKLVSDFISSGLLSLISLIAGNGPVGLFGSLFGGFFADGGDPPVGKISVVGDAPGGKVTPYTEFIVPKSPVSVVPQSKMGSLLENVYQTKTAVGQSVDMSPVTRAVDRVAVQIERSDKSLSLMDKGGDVIAKNVNRSNTIAKLRKGA